MNRVKIKEEARKIMKGNIWNIILPFIVVGLIEALVLEIFGGSTDNRLYTSSLSFLISCVFAPLTFGCVVYVLNFVRNKPYDLKLIFSFYPRFIYIFAMYFLVSLMTFAGMILLIVPGIILSIGCTMAPFIMADGEQDPVSSIKKSLAMMKGYKWDYFKFIISFIGWYLLMIPTFGFIIIYVGPYVTVSQVLYYEELKKLN